MLLAAAHEVLTSCASRHVVLYIPWQPLQALIIAAALGTLLAAGLELWSDAALAAMGAGPEAGRLHDQAAAFLSIRCAL